jgi:zinc transport system substrate-binding protein
MPRLASLLVILLLLLALTTPACRRAAPPAPPGPRPLSVVVSIPPLVGLVKPLLTQGGEVRTLIPAGHSEHGFEFTAADLRALTGADVVVYIGLGLEPALETFLSTHPSPHRRIVRFASLLPDGELAATDLQGGEGHSGAAAADPHLWLDPHLCQPLVIETKAAIQASYRDRAPLSPVALRDSEHAAESQIARLRQLDEYARTTLAPFRGRALVTHHRAWERLADRYGLTIAAVIRPIETGEPTPGAITGAIDAIRDRHVTAIFVEPQFSRAAADRIAQATGVRVATIDPLGDGDYFATMRANIDAIAGALAPAPSPP